MAKQHVWFVVAVNPERSIKRRHVGRQIGRVGHRLIRSLRLVSHKHMASPSWDDVSRHGVDFHLLIGECGKKIVFVVVLMNFRRPHHRSGSHPGIRVDFERKERSFPHCQVLTFPEHSSRSSHVVRLRLCVGEHERVAEPDGVGRHIGLWLSAVVIVLCLKAGHKQQRKEKSDVLHRFRYDNGYTIH